MATTLRDLHVAATALWPLSGVEDWDVVGLTVGAPSDAVTRVLLAVDPVAATVEEAVEGGYDLLLTHHPLLLRGVQTLAGDRVKGALVTKLIRGGCALYSAHTNADSVDAGTSGVLAARLGLQDPRPFDAQGDAEADSGIGRVGDLAAPTTLGQLARQLAGILPSTAVGVLGSGDFDRPVRRVAICGGAGDSYLAHPAVLGADVYITADLRHHPAQDAREQAELAGGPALLGVSHWASEWLWLDTAAAQLREALPGVEFVVSELRTDPWDFAVVQ